jgi:hypothetical protein
VAAGAAWRLATTAYFAPTVFPWLEVRMVARPRDRSLVRRAVLSHARAPQRTAIARALLLHDATPRGCSFCAAYAASGAPQRLAASDKSSKAD